MKKRIVKSLVRIYTAWIVLIIIIAATSRNSQSVENTTPALAVSTHK